MENEPQFKIGDIVILKSDALKHFPIVMTVNEIGKEDPLRLSLLREKRPSPTLPVEGEGDK